MDEKLIQKHMQTLKCTREEAIQLIKDDEDVDRGIAKPWDLTPEQIKNQRKIANVSTRKRTGETKARTKKENPDKQAIITCMQEALASMDGVDGLTFTNAERTLDFTFNDINYTISLTAHRK